MPEGVTIQSGIANNGIVPIGGIIMWSGTVATIPANWQLCNGTNGTPDLRDKFIVGATADNGGVAKTNLTGSLTQNGGAISHHHADHAFTQPGAHSNHIFTQSGDHAAHTHTGPSHQHNLSGGAATAHGHDYTTVIAHTHKLATGTGASGNFAQVVGTIDASSGGTGAAPTQSNLDTSSQSTGSASGTTANNAAGATDNSGTGASGNPSATLTHSGGAVDAHSAHSGGAVDAHDTLSAPQPYFALAFIQRLS